MRSFFVGLLVLLIIGFAGFFAFRAINRFVVGRLEVSPSPVASMTPSPRPTPAPSSTPKPVEHVTVPAGLGGFSLLQILSLVGGAAIALTIVYKLSYKWYIIG